LVSGMEIARINCSHDNPQVWTNMIDAIYKAKKQSGKDCKIYMDLSGPKIRTEEIHILNKKNRKKGDLILHIGDRIKLYSTEAELKKAIDKNTSEKNFAALVSMSIPNIVSSIEVGNHIWFDDGKIEGVIEEKIKKYATVHITKARTKGTKLKKEK